MKFIELMKKIGCAKYFAIFQLEELDYTEIMNLVEVDDVDEVKLSLLLFTFEIFLFFSP